MLELEWRVKQALPRVGEFCRSCCARETRERSRSRVVVARAQVVEAGAMECEDRSKASDVEED